MPQGRKKCIACGEIRAQGDYAHGAVGRRGGGLRRSICKYCEGGQNDPLCVDLPIQRQWEKKGPVKI